MNVTREPKPGSGSTDDAVVAADPDPVADAAARRRRRRLAEILAGSLLPDTTADERDPGSTGDRDSAGDRWLNENRPPHHGG